MQRGRAKEGTKWMVSMDVSPLRCWRASGSMIFAHSSIGKPETPVQIAGKAMDLRLRSAARRREWAVEVRRVFAVVRMPPRLMLAAWMTWRALSLAPPGMAVYAPGWLPALSDPCRDDSPPFRAMRPAAPATRAQLLL